MNKIKIIFAIFLIVIFLIFGIWLVKRFQKNQVNYTAVITEIRSLNRWETASFSVEKIIDSGSSGNVFTQFLFGNRILLIAHGQVVGGFNLSNLPNSGVEINGSSITVKLPAPEILITTLDESQTKVYDRQKGLLVSSDNNLESDARSAAVSNIHQAACSGGILNAASDNAKKELTSMLKPFGFTSITISILQGSC